MKRFNNMNEDQRRGERLRRLPLLVKAFRDLDRHEIRLLVVAALCVDNMPGLAKEILP